MTSMTIFMIAGAAAFGAIVGLFFGAAIGAGARSDQDFEEYAKKHENGKH